MQVYFRKFYGLLELVFAISSRFRKRNVVTVHCLFLQLLKSCWPSWVSITRKFKNDNWPFPKMFAHLYLDITVKEISASENCLWITLRKQRINITLSRFHLHWNVLRNGLYVIYALHLIYSIYSLPVLLQATTAFAFIFDFKREDVTGTFLSFHRRCISKNYALHLKNYVSKNYL